MNHATQDLTREQWLNLLSTRYLWPLIEQHDGEVRDNVRMSVGFPGGSGTRRTAVGQCWYPDSSSDKSFEVFVSPILSVYDAVHTLLHELVHASVGPGHGHKGPFRKLAKAVGLAGKMTATVPGDELKAKINGWLEELPAYPHAQLLPGMGGGTKQTTRLIKCQCSECGYTVRTTSKWIDLGGAPICPVDEIPMEVA